MDTRQAGQKSTASISRSLRTLLVSIVAVLLLGTGLQGALAPTTANAASYPVDKSYYRYIKTNLWTINGGAPTNQRCGSKALILMAYDVATRWYGAHPDNPIRFWDMNATGHDSHKRGVDFDLDTSKNTIGNVNVAYRTQNIELGKMFVDTGIIKNIFFNDTTVQNAVNTYAKRTVMTSETGHKDHFHVRISDNFRLNENSTSCPAGAKDLAPGTTTPVVPGPPTAAPILPSRPDRLLAGEGIRVGQKLTSPNGAYTLELQGDGNIVAYRPGHIAYWGGANTTGRGTFDLKMQSDGNLVAYNGTSNSLWDTKTQGNPGATFEIQSDGNLVVYNASHTAALWSSGTKLTGLPASFSGDTLYGGQGVIPGQKLVSSNGAFALEGQTDGNAVIYGPGHIAKWATNTSGKSLFKFVFQPDGNAVAYDVFGGVLGASNTYNKGATRMVMQNDGNLVIYNASGGALWASANRPGGGF